MYCIFVCVFNQVQYVEMFLVMLDSIATFGNINKTIEILVYTSSIFANLIKQSELYRLVNEKSNIVFAINDNYNNVDLACKARLDLFDLPHIPNYTKFLYLDTDIIVKSDITKLFELKLDDKLYALKEGSIRKITHGGHLFKIARIRPKNKPAFTTGILLFNNCDKIKELFIDIKNDIIARPYKFSCADQPYIVYMAFMKNAYNNELLCNYVVNHCPDVDSDKIIHHFNITPGKYQSKIPAMSYFLNQLKLKLT